VCVLQKGTVGSNPTLSAINLEYQVITKFTHLITHPAYWVRTLYALWQYVKKTLENSIFRL